MDLVARPPMVVVPVVVAATVGDAAAADEVAARLRLQRLSLDAWSAGEGGPLVVWCDRGGPALRGPAASGARPVRPSLVRTPRHGRDLLVRAVGPGREIVDATAGWGVDASIVAASGRDVVMVERHPLLALMLSHAIEHARALGHRSLPRLVEADARVWLSDASTDVVLLDPMYPLPDAGGRRPPRKSEGLHLVRLLVGDDPDQGDLLDVASRAARRRVVVKRPVLAPQLAGRAPSGSLRGRTVRYDLYAPQEVPT